MMIPVAVTTLSSFEEAHARAPENREMHDARCAFCAARLFVQIDCAHVISSSLRMIVDSKYVICVRLARANRTYVAELIFCDIYLTNRLTRIDL